MTGTKRLSLHGRLRMAAACPDPNAALLAEAADAIEQHEAFRQEVSDEIVRLGCWPDTINLQRFIIVKPDPLAEAWIEATGNTVGMEPLNEALAKRGGKIVWGDD